jgi:toxoflavin biosynthesis protein ToxD
MGFTVFISYSRRDDDFITRLLPDLLAHNVDVWLDHIRLKPGTEDWEKAIREGIRSSQAVVLIASPDSRQSPYVRDELDIAKNYQIPVFPLWAAGHEWIESIPLGWGRHQYSDARGLRYEEGLQHLLSVLGTDPRTHYEGVREEQRQPALPVPAEQVEAAFAEQDWQAVIDKTDFLIRRAPAAVPSAVYRMYGRALLEIGEPKHAGEALDRALALDPAHVPTLQLAAQARLRLGQESEAAQMLREALAVANDPAERMELLQESAGVLAKLGQWAELLRRADEALRLVPDDPTWVETYTRALTHVSPERFPARLADLGFGARKIGGVEVIVPPVVSVPAGEFTMGSDAKQDKDSDDDEKPQHSVTQQAFQIGKYPVTVAEYACFTRSGHREPTNWQSQLAKPDHPVVNVTWGDAVAYTAWLASRTAQSWRLPSEAQWEKAARWDPAARRARRYPWGDTFDKARANVKESGKETTTPVGTYPNGASPCGSQDMVGNVWEWTSTVFRPYPYSHTDGREDPDATQNRVLRGGSWDTYARNVRAAYRHHKVPVHSDNNIGLRLVLVPRT